MINSWVIRIGALVTLSLLVSCGGGGGGGVLETVVVTPPTPLAVLPSSYENKNAAVPVELTQLPRLSAVAAFVPGLAGTDSVPASLAVADFQRSGSYSAFVIASDGSSQSRAFFVGYGVASGWSDLSDALFRSSSDRAACLRPEQSAVADLNGDGRPDIYVACSGSSGGSVAQLLYMSQSDGKYVKTTLSVSLNASGVALADIDGNGCKDVATTHNGALQILMATACSGSYTLTLPADNAGRIPQSGVALPPSNIRNVFLVPRLSPARYDLLVGGDGSLGFSFKWYLNNDSSGYFDTLDATKVRSFMLTDTGNNRYDYLESGDYGYIYVRNGSTQAFGALTRVPVPRTGSTIAYSSLIPSVSHTLVDWPAAIRLVGTSLRVFDAGCDLSVVLNNQTRCGRFYQLSDFPP